MKKARRVPPGSWSFVVITVGTGLVLVIFLSPPPQGLDRCQAAADSPLSAWENPSSIDREGPVYDPDPQGSRNRIFESLRVSSWHAQGWRGQGVKVAILDSGFHGYRAHLGRALPTHVRTRSFRGDGDLEAKESQHGILCAEVVHAIAPEADILLGNWEPDRPDQFLAAVRWARAEGARLISCSLIMPTWSDYEGHGPVHEELTRLVGCGDRAGHLLFFASAGNTALRHWSGPFQNAGNGCHLWVPGQSDNRIQPWEGERVSVELCASVGACFEVLVYDRTMNRLVGRCRNTREASQSPVLCRSAVVGFSPTPYDEYSVQVRCIDKPTNDPGGFHLVVLGGSLRYATRQASICFPGDGAEVVAVGAVDSTGQRFPYSSCGRRSTSPKPDLVAVVPFPSLWRPRPFNGTSAAAPQAAALAALLWSRHSEWTARQVRYAVQQAAYHPTAADIDSETGYGQIRLP
jgi:subtilisin family serine protease